ncbi:MAG TPA: LLM class flavin-dependent oxidoreductase, partial [Anaerolineae bacterium]|nr:LLM class flavin-dependent oxidoreductase [Anaerolineae bacterium]
VDAHRTATTPFDIVVEGKTPGADPDRAADTVRAWAEAGATWWIEAMWGDPDQPVDLKAVQQRIQQGPPRFE